MTRGKLSYSIIITRTRGLPSSLCSVSEVIEDEKNEQNEELCARAVVAVHEEVEEEPMK